MTIKKVIKNTFSNWVGLGFNVVIQFFLSPFIVHSLGDEKYGLWTLIMAITGYYGLLDIGIRSGVSYYFTKYNAKKQVQDANQVTSSAFVILTGVALICIITSIIIGLNFNVLFKAKSDISTNIFLTILLIGINFSLSFPMATFSAVITSLQRFEIINGIDIFLKICHTILVILVLKHGYGILGLALITLFRGISQFICLYIVSGKIFRELKIRLSLFSLTKVKRICKYGIFSFILLLSQQIIDYTDTLIIGIFLDLKAITYYSIGRMIINYLGLLVSSFSRTLTPIATTHAALDREDRLSVLLINGTKFINYLIIPIFIALIFWGKDFIQLWMGSKYVNGEECTSAYTILVLLSAGLFLPLAFHSTWQIIFGMNKHRVPAMLTGFEALLNLILSVTLVKKFGLPGVAIGTALPAIMIRGFIIPHYVCRKLNFNYLRFLFLTFLKPGLLSCVLILIVHLYKYVLPYHISWSFFIIKVVIFYISFIAIFLLTNIERELNIWLIKILKLKNI